MQITQTDAETCSLAGGGGFVAIYIPVEVTGDVGEDRHVLLRCVVGNFEGRERRWPVRSGRETKLPFRIPREVFREGAPITVAAFAADGGSDRDLLWAKRYEADWTAGKPRLQLISD